MSATFSRSGCGSLENESREDGSEDDDDDDGSGEGTACVVDVVGAVDVFGEVVDVMGISGFMVSDGVDVVVSDGAEVLLSDGDKDDCGDEKNMVMVASVDCPFVRWIVIGIAGL